MKSTKVIRFNLKPKKSKPHENRNKTFSRDRIKTGQKKWKLNRSVKRLQVLNRIKNNPPRTNFGIFSFRGLRWKKSLTNFFHQPSLEARTFWVRQGFSVRSHMVHHKHYRACNGNYYYGNTNKNPFKDKKTRFRGWWIWISRYLRSTVLAWSSYSGVCRLV